MGMGSHRRWCVEVVGHSASIWGPMSQGIHSKGDMVGANCVEATNLLYRAAWVLEQAAWKSARQYQALKTL